MFYAFVFVFFLSFSVCGSVLPMFYAPFLIFFFFSSLPESRFCQCSMPLYLNFYLFFCACVLVLPMFYASLFTFFFCFVSVAQF